MKIVKDLQQGTIEWLQLRVGMPSASQFKNIVTSDGKKSKTYAKYRNQLAGERVTGFREEIYQNEAMRTGLEREPVARELFTMSTGIEVSEVGMCIHDSDLFSCSPDGLISDHSGIEIKCPNMATHIEYLLGKRVPTDYYQQVHGSMLVTGYDEWFFMSFYPGLRPFVHLEKRDNEFCDKLEAELMLFCEDLTKLVEELKA